MTTQNVSKPPAPPKSSIFSHHPPSLLLLSLDLVGMRNMMPFPSQVRLFSVLAFVFCLTMVPLFFFSFLFFDESLFRSWFPLGRTDPFLFVCWTFPLRFLFVKKKSHFCSKHKCIFFKSEKMTVDLREKGSGRCVCLLNGWRDRSRSWRND